MFLINRLNIKFNKVYDTIPAPLISIFLMIISGFFFVLMHSAVKYLSQEVHIFEIAFFRCALVIVVLAPVIFQQGQKIFKTHQPKMQVLRITTNSVAMLCFFLWNFNHSISSVNNFRFYCAYFCNYSCSNFYERKNKIKKNNRFSYWFHWDNNCNAT